MAITKAGSQTLYAVERANPGDLVCLDVPVTMRDTKTIGVQQRGFRRKKRKHADRTRAQLELKVCRAHDTGSEFKQRLRAYIDADHTQGDPKKTKKAWRDDRAMMNQPTLHAEERAYEALEESYLMAAAIGLAGNVGDLGLGKKANLLTDDERRARSAAMKRIITNGATDELFGGQNGPAPPAGVQGADLVKLQGAQKNHFNKALAAQHQLIKQRQDLHVGRVIRGGMGGETIDVLLGSGR